MYAIVESGSKQYKVSKNDEIIVERLPLKKGAQTTLKQVLLFKDGKKVNIGKPYLKDISVVCEILFHHRAKKVIAFKYRRRKKSKSKIGHRQEFTKLKVKEIKVKG